MRSGEGFLKFLRTLHADRLTAQSLGYSHVINAIPRYAVRGIGVDVVKRQAHLVVHFEAPLRLTDQAKIGIIDDDMKVRELVLGTYREFLDHKLEIVVS